MKTCLQFFLKPTRKNTIRTILMTNSKMWSSLKSNLITSNTAAMCFSRVKLAMGFTLQSQDLRIHCLRLGLQVCSNAVWMSCQDGNCSEMMTYRILKSECKMVFHTPEREAQVSTVLFEEPQSQSYGALKYYCTLLHS